MENAAPHRRAAGGAAAAVGMGAVVGRIYCAGDLGEAGAPWLGAAPARWFLRLVWCSYVRHSPLFRMSGRLGCLRGPTAVRAQSRRRELCCSAQPGGTRAGGRGCCDEAKPFHPITQDKVGSSEDKIPQGNKVLCKQRNYGARNHRRPAGSNQLCWRNLTMKWLNCQQKISLIKNECCMEAQLLLLHP